VDLDRQRENSAFQEKAIDFRRGGVYYGKKRAEMRCVGEEKRIEPWLLLKRWQVGRQMGIVFFHPSMPKGNRASMARACRRELQPMISLISSLRSILLSLLFFHFYLQFCVVYLILAVFFLFGGVIVSVDSTCAAKS
jgi:hypothetical protein